MEEIFESSKKFDPEIWMNILDSDLPESDKSIYELMCASSM